MTTTRPAVIDIGVNLLNRQFQKDLPQVLKRSHEENVQTIVATGTDLKNSERTIAYIRKRGIQTPRLVCTAGVHPHSAGRDASSNIPEKLNKFVQKNRDIVVAIGECGLDYNRDFSPRDVQIDVFRQQVELACTLKMPIFCHEREAHQDFLRVLMPFLETGQLKPSQVVVHCFTGSYSELQTYIRHGFYIGITGFIAMGRRGQELRQSVRTIPLGQLMVETDAPFMHPLQPRQRCEPHHIHIVVETIAECMGLTVEDVATATTANSNSFFNLTARPVELSKQPHSLEVPSDSSMIQVDGSTLEGGGQILRLAFPLAAMLKKDIRVHSIRAGRSKPGLGNQHLCGLNLLDSMSSSWSIQGGHMKSTSASLTHNAANVELNDHVFRAEMSTGGAVSLVLQGILPLLLFAPSDVTKELHLSGGTHGMFAPTVDWIQLTLFPLLHQMGIDANINMIRRGFPPRGEGSIVVSLPPRDGSPLRALSITTTSRTPVQVTCKITCGSMQVGEAALGALKKEFRHQYGIIASSNPWTEEIVVDNGVKKQSVAIHVSVLFEDQNILTAGGPVANSVEKGISTLLHDFDLAWSSNGCVDEHLADNLLVYMALAQGTSQLRIPLTTSSKHVEAAIYVISLVTGVSFNCDIEEKSRLVSCVGLGWRGK